MKRGDLVKTSSGIGVVVAYHKEPTTSPTDTRGMFGLMGRLIISKPIK